MKSQTGWLQTVVLSTTSDEESNRLVTGCSSGHYQWWRVKQVSYRISSGHYQWWRVKQVGYRISSGHYQWWRVKQVGYRISSGHSQWWRVKTGHLQAAVFWPLPVMKSQTGWLQAVVLSTNSDEESKQVSCRLGFLPLPVMKSQTGWLWAVVRSTTSDEESNRLVTGCSPVHIQWWIVKTG